MWPLAPLVIRLAAVSLVALVLADPGSDTALSVMAKLPKKSTVVPIRPTAPMTRKQERRLRNRRRTTTTTTTTEIYDDEEDHTTPITTTTIDPRTFDHSKY